MLDDAIFAFGYGRSGTTLLAKLIDASRSVLYRHEPDKTLPTSRIPFLPEPGEYPLYLDAAREYLRALLNEKSPSVSGKGPVFGKDYRSLTATLALRAAAPALVTLEKAGLRLPVPDLVTSGSARYLVKSVNSLCRVPLFALAVPGMKFVHIVRHPGAVVASQLRGRQLDKMHGGVHVEAVSEMSNARSMPVDVGQVREGTFGEQCAYAWMLQNDKTESEMRGRPDYLLLSYEDLCANMTERMAEICRFVGIEFDAQMRGFVDRISGVTGDGGYFSVMKNPLANIDRWESVLPRDEIGRVESMARHSRVGRFSLSRYAAVKAQLAGAQAG